MVLGEFNFFVEANLNGQKTRKKLHSSISSINFLQRNKDCAPSTLTKWLPKYIIYIHIYDYNIYVL